MNYILDATADAKFVHDMHMIGYCMLACIFTPMLMGLALAYHEWRRK